MLGPTSTLSGLLLGQEFEFRAGQGYLSRELSLMISPACAGINFMLVAFVALALGHGRRFNGGVARLGWVALALVVAYAAALAVNAVRIGLSAEVARPLAFRLGTSFDEVHRAVGMACCLAALMALHFGAEASFRRLGGHLARGPAPRPWLPLAAYAGVMLLVPLLRGAASDEAFARHALMLGCGLACCCLLLFARRCRTWNDGRHEFGTSQHSPQHFR